MKVSTTVLFSFVFGATPAFALYNGWNGKAGNSVFNDGGNWGGNPNFSRAACVSGAQSQIGNMPNGTYTLTAARLEFDLSEFLPEYGGDGGRLVLADAEECNYDAQVVRNSNAALQAKYPKCSLVVDGTKLILKTPSGLDTLVIFR